MNLTALQHSALLQSLGWAIANSLWQAGILWVLYFFITSSYKNASAKFKTNLASAFLFSSFIWFIVTFITKLLLLNKSITDVNNSPVIFSSPLSYTTNYNWQLILDRTIKTLPYLSMAYLFLLVLLSLRLINSYRYIYFIKVNGLQKPSVEWRLFADKVANHIGITKKIKIWLSEHIDVPATIGFLKPIILIPVASLNQLSVEQLEAVILHELSHIKRNDYLLNLFVSLIETILFFNPFVVLLSKIIKAERENCCDDFVIQYQYDRHSYASALLSLEQYRNQNLRLALTATSGKKVLLQRIKRIMEVKSKSPSLNYGQKLLALFLITGIICSIAWLSPEKKGIVTQHTKNEITVQPKKEKDKIKNILSTVKDIALKTISQNSKDKKWKEELASDLQNIDTAFITEPNSPEATLEQQSKKLIDPKEVYKKLEIKFKKDMKIAPAAFANIFQLNNLQKNAQFQNLSLENIENIKTELEKLNVNFNINWNKIQGEINKSLKKIQLSDIDKNLLEEKVQEAYDKQVDLLKEKNEKTNKLKSQGRTVFGLPHSRRSKEWADSLSVVDYNNAVANNENYKLFQRRFPVYDATTVMPEEIYKNSPGNRTYAYSYDNKITIAHTNPAAPKVIVPSHTKISVECKNGLVYINGNKINLPNVIMPGNKSRSKKIIITTNDEDEVTEVNVSN